MNLMYSTTQDKPVNRAMLSSIVTPPALGRFHRPYSFAEYVTDVHEALDRQNIQVHSEEYAVTKTEKKLFGLMEIEPPALEGELIEKKDWNLMLGLRGSHDQTIPRGLVIGTRVIVCSNLCFSGDIAQISSKQTLRLRSRLPGLIGQAVARIPALAQRQVKVFDAYRNHQMTAKQGDAGLVDVYRRQGLTSAQLGKAITEWHEPAHNEHGEQGWTAWRFMNAITEALKPTGSHVNMDLVNRRSQIATRVTNELAGVDF